MSFFIECSYAYCEYQTKSKEDFKRHFKIEHTPIPVSYKWWYCNKCESWEQPADFKIHEKLNHAGEKNWLHCQEVGCEYKCSKLSKLRSHTRKMHIDVII